jgi:DNA-directed RNA polymerase subunit RPC12/RpoP
MEKITEDVGNDVFCPHCGTGIWDNIFNLWAGGDRDTYLEEYRCPKCNTELEVEMVPMFFVSEMD